MKITKTTNSVIWEISQNTKNVNWEKLWHPVIKTTENPKSKAYYGFGWIIDERNGRKVIEHGGANVGFRSYYTRFVDKDLTIIIMTNTDGANPAAIVKALANYYFANK